MLWLDGILAAEYMNVNPVNSARFSRPSLPLPVFPCYFEPSFFRIGVVVSSAHGVGVVYAGLGGDLKGTAFGRYAEAGV